MLAAAVASVLPLAIAGARHLTRPCNDALDQRFRLLAQFALGSLVATAVVGFMAGYLRYVSGDTHYLAMLSRFPSRFYLFASIEWGVSLLCLGLWVASWEWGRSHWRVHGLLVLVAATNLIYHFPPLMILQQMLADRPELIAEEIVTRRLALGLFLQGEVISRSLHFLAVACLLSCAILLPTLPHNLAPLAARIRAAAAWGGMLSTMGVILSGIAVLIFIPGTEAAWLTGQNNPATLAMLMTVGLSLAILACFAQLATHEPTPRLERRPLQLTILATFLMTLADRLAI